jgi:hypothetical protein
MRAWISDYSDEHLPYIGTLDQQEELLARLSEAENWLLDGEGEYATFIEYNKKYNELNDVYFKLKMRKDEHQKRPEAVKRALKRLEELEDEAKDLTEKKPWINQTQVDEVLKFTQEVKSWLDEALSK